MNQQINIFINWVDETGCLKSKDGEILMGQSNIINRRMVHRGTE